MILVLHTVFRHDSNDPHVNVREEANEALMIEF